jgi:hypothetical protein
MRFDNASPPPLRDKSFDTALLPNAFRESENSIVLKRPGRVPLFDQALMQQFELFTTFIRQKQIFCVRAVCKRIFFTSRLSCHFVTLHYVCRLESASFPLRFFDALGALA